MAATRTEVPSWALGVFSGVLCGALFGVGMGLFTRSDGSSWVAAGVAAVATGIPFGLAMGWWSAKWLRQMKDAESDLPADKVKSAHLAAMGGPVPDDEEIRAAALRIASQWLAAYDGRTRKLSIVTLVLVLVGSLIGAVTESPWGLLGVMVSAVVLYGQWYWPRRFRRRIRELTEAEEATTT